MSNPTVTFLFSFVIALHFSACKLPEPKPVNKALVKDLAEPLGVTIDRISELHNVPPTLGHALVEAESSYDDFNVSHTGAMGLTQVLKSTARGECGIRSNKTLFNREANLNCGFSYLAKLKARYGTWYRALVSYKMGMKHVNNPDLETKQYAMKILRRAKI